MNRSERRAKKTKGLNERAVLSPKAIVQRQHADRMAEIAELEATRDKLSEEFDERQ